MYQKLRQILSTATFRQTSLTSVSSVINGALGAAFYFVLARLLGSAAYGQFSLITSAVAALAGVADLGSDQALVRFASKDPGYIKAALAVKSVSSLIFILVLIIISPTWISFVIGLGILTQLLFSFSVSVSQSLQKYIHWSLLLIGTNMLRLLFLVFILNNLSSLSVSIVYIICPLIGFLLFLLLSPSKTFSAPVSRRHFLDIFAFNKWITAFVVINTLGSRLDIFLTARFTNLSFTGTYSLATQLVSILPQLTTALGAVTAPKFASFTSSTQNQTYIAKSTLFSVFIAALSSLILIAAAWIIIRFTGRGYSSAWQPFLILLVGMDLFLTTAPLRDSLLYYYVKPKFFVWTGIAQILITLVLSYLLIPLYGTVGSALLVLTSQIFLAAVSYLYFRRLHKHHA